MEVISVNVIKDMKETEHIAMVCNCVLFYYDCINFTSQIQNIIFNMLFVIADVNECNNVTYPCHANATCINTNGSYICHCRKGFDGDGTNCTGMYLISFTMFVTMIPMVVTNDKHYHAWFMGSFFLIYLKKRNYLLYSLVFRK